MATTGEVLYGISVKLENLEISFAKVETRFDNFDKQFSNHLHKHWQVTVIALSTAITAIGSLLAIILFGGK